MIDKTATHDMEAAPELDGSGIPQGTGGKQPAGGYFALFLAILALAFATIGIAAGYKHWQRMNDKVRAHAEQLKQLQERLAGVPDAAAVEGLRRELDARTANLNAAHEEAKQEVARMLNQTHQFADTVAAQVEQVTFLQSKMQQGAAPKNTAEWRLEEVRHLLQLANRQLHIAQDARSAAAALKEADAALAKSSSVTYLPVRQQIALDLAALEAVQLPDIPGLSQRITALMLGLQPLPAVDTASGTRISLRPQGEGAAANTWSDKLLQALDDAIVVRRHDQPIQTALDAETRQHIYQLLRLRLENLRLLLLQRDQQGFRAQLDLLRELVKSYYPADTAQPLLEAFDEFAKVELQPALPDISGSLRQLDSARQAELETAKPNGKAAETRSDSGKAAAKSASQAKLEAKAADKTEGKSEAKPANKAEDKAE